MAHWPADMKAGSIPPASIPAAGDIAGNRVGAVLFVVVFIYCWVSVNPFENLQSPPANAAALNQITGFLLTIALFIYAAANGLTSMILRPRSLILLLFGWLAITSLMSVEPLVALRRLFFTGLICACASLLLVLPKSREQFTRLIAISALVILGASYLGVFLIPGRAVHQAYDLVEPGLAGDWRGVFNHKNGAAPAMVILCFFGLYVMRTSTGAARGAIVVLSLVFLWMTNGKTALGMFPLVLVLAFFLVRTPVFGALLLGATLAATSTITLGSALSPQIHKFLADLGTDPTFTARTEIWSLALKAVAQQPVLGYGFGSFWGSDMLLNSADADDTWAVEASHAHNGFIEALLSGGIPAFVLTVLWLVVLPLRDIAAARARRADPALTILFTRIWVYCVLSALLESNFFAGTGAVWVSLLIGVFGLRQQARNHLVVENERPG